MRRFYVEVLVLATIVAEAGRHVFFRWVQLTGLTAIAPVSMTESWHHET